MKKLNRFSYAIAGILAIALICGAGTLITSCSTNATQTTIKAEGALITSVDVGMHGWATYVGQHTSDGKVTQAQIDAVKQAYNAYYVAQQVAKAAIEKQMASGSTNSVDVSLANTSVGQAEAALLTLLNQYITQK